MSIEDIVKNTHYKHVVITGGEPTEQLAELRQLINALQKEGRIVGLESNGTFEGYNTLGCNHVVVSPKAKAMYCVFPAGVDELKYVVTEDFDATVAIPESIRQKFAGRIWLQPCDYYDERTRKMFDRVYAIVLTDGRLKCGIQLHKVYGVR